MTSARSFPAFIPGLLDGGQTWTELAAGVQPIQDTARFSCP
jgi:hypothetical protein